MSKVYGAAFQYQHSVVAVEDVEVETPGNIAIYPTSASGTGVVHLVPVDNNDADYDEIAFTGFTILPGIYKQLLSSSTLNDAVVKFVYRSA